MKLNFYQPPTILKIVVDHLLLKGMVQEKIDLVNIKGSLYASNFGAQHIPIRAP